MIGGDALQPADRDGLAVDAAAAARRLARAIAGAAKNAREHVRLAIEDVGVIEPALRDHPDVFRDVRMRGTRPLAVDDLVVVIRVRGIRPIHDFPELYAARGNGVGAGCGPKRQAPMPQSRWFRPDSVMNPFSKRSFVLRSSIVATA